MEDKLLTVRVEGPFTVKEYELGAGTEWSRIIEVKWYTEAIKLIQAIEQLAAIKGWTLSVLGGTESNPIVTVFAPQAIV